MKKIKTLLGKNIFIEAALNYGNPRHKSCSKADLEVLISLVHVNVVS